MSRHNLGIGAIFAAPAAIATASLVGLVGALLGDGGWDLVGAGLLGAAILAIIRARFTRRDRQAVAASGAPRQDGTPGIARPLRRASQAGWEPRHDRP